MKTCRAELSRILVAANTKLPKCKQVCVHFLLLQTDDHKLNILKPQCIISQILPVRCLGTELWSTVLWVSLAEIKVSAAVLICGLEFSSELTGRIGIGRIYFFLVVGLKFHFLADCRPGTALSSQRLFSGLFSVASLILRPTIAL